MHLADFGFSVFGLPCFGDTPSPRFMYDINHIIGDFIFVVNRQFSQTLSDNAVFRGAIE